MTEPLFLVNGRFLSQPMTGVNRFAYQVCETLHRGNVPFAVVAPKNVLSSYTCRFPVVQTGLVSGPLWEMTDLHLYLRRHGNPLLVSLSGLGPVGYDNQVITIHDLAFLENPEWYSKSYVRYYGFFTRRLAVRSRCILTVSETSRSAIVRKLNIPESKILVVNNAVDFSGIQPRKPDGMDEKAFILSVGSMDPRKNLERILSAFSESGLQHTCRLVLVGKEDKVFRMTASAEIKAAQLGYVSDEELVWLYQHATLFVYPSLLEGFGIPPLEAMSQGCPVVLSDIPVFRELYEGAAFFADPMNSSDIAAGMNRVQHEPGLREELIRRGKEKAARFTWTATANRISELAEHLRQNPVK